MTNTTPAPIADIAARLALEPRDWEPLGWHKAKLAHGLLDRLAARPVGKYVGVTAITPTPLGEGKTVTTIGLAMALERLGHRTIAALREPSLAPVFGMKGGGAGGGRSRLEPFTDINLHFTGDLHAITSATNLLAALIDNHVKRGKAPVLEPTSITWRRVLDVNDKALSRVVTGLGPRLSGPLRETGFELTAASELMAIVALATGLEDLRARVGRMIIGYTPGGEPVSCEELRATGPLLALLVEALRPNLAQTSERTPALVHGGPFANIAHGNSSVLADLIGLRLAEYVVTESGFGADCGAEKLFDIKCRSSGLRPAVEVVVCTVRALKLHSGRFKVVPGKPLPAEMLAEDLDALRAGACNLEGHLAALARFGVPAVVAINRFPTDHDAEVDALRQLALEAGAVGAEVSDVFARGGEGAEALARVVVSAAATPSAFRFLYPLELPLAEKLETVAREIYGAEGVDLDPAAERQLARFEALGYGALPVSIAKTQYSFSADPARLGRPRGFRFPIREARLSAGAGFVYALSGEITTMPGLPAEPGAHRIDVDSDGRVVGLT
ncbi:MAG: formate--tetrahydrofolate ligase [Polyangiaceae bacterium]|nr:formate--tetrahydrofolate ligase [Polyangiaceae bacterium]